MAYFYGYILIGAAFCFIPKISNDLREMRTGLLKSYLNSQPDFKIFAWGVMVGSFLYIIFLWPLEIPSLLRGKK